MSNIVVNSGEQYILKNNLNGDTLTVGLYNDATDAISDADGTGAITTEPGNTNYGRQSTTFSVSTTGDNDGLVSSDNKLSFDFSDLGSQTDLDSYFITDGAGTLIATGALNQTRTVGGGAIETFELEAGGAAISLD
jgi:hypothetical protein